MADFLFEGGGGCIHGVGFLFVILMEYQRILTFLVFLLLMSLPLLVISLSSYATINTINSHTSLKYSNITATLRYAPS